VSVIINEFEVVPRPEERRGGPLQEPEQKPPEAPPANRDHEISKTLSQLYDRALRVRAD
jgi:hypothetical protein